MEMFLDTTPSIFPVAQSYVEFPVVQGKHIEHFAVRKTNLFIYFILTTPSWDLGTTRDGRPFLSTSVVAILHIPDNICSFHFKKMFDSLVVHGNSIGCDVPNIGGIPCQI
jgi:hypothetical protein